MPMASVLVVNGGPSRRRMPAQAQTPDRVSTWLRTAFVVVISARARSGALTGSARVHRPALDADGARSPLAIVRSYSFSGMAEEWWLTISHWPSW